MWACDFNYKFCSQNPVTKLTLSAVAIKYICLLSPRAKQCGWHKPMKLLRGLCSLGLSMGDNSSVYAINPF